MGSECIVLHVNCVMQFTVKSIFYSVVLIVLALSLSPKGSNGAMIGSLTCVHN